MRQQALCFMVTAVLHNIFNIRWYKALKKGTYSRKRKLVTAINIALAGIVAATLLTGVIQSGYLFSVNIRIAGIGQIHMILALAGFVLTVSHVLVHAFSHTKTKYRKLPVILTALVSALAVFLGMWLFPYLKRHFKTVEIDRETVISGETVDLGGGKKATVILQEQAIRILRSMWTRFQGLPCCLMRIRNYWGTVR